MGEGGVRSIWLRTACVRGGGRLASLLVLTSSLVWVGLMCVRGRGRGRRHRNGEDDDWMTYNASAAAGDRRVLRSSKGGGGATLASGWSEPPHVGQGPLYLAIVLVCCLPVGLVCARTFVGRRPRSLSERSFAIAYDVLLKRCVGRGLLQSSSPFPRRPAGAHAKPSPDSPPHPLLRSFLRNHLALGLCVFLGFFEGKEFFTLQLLDIVVISPVIADIIKSVTSPGVALGLVFYLFLVSVVVYAAFGMRHFPTDLQVTPEAVGSRLCARVVISTKRARPTAHQCVRLFNA